MFLTLLNQHTSPCHHYEDSLRVLKKDKPPHKKPASHLSPDKGKTKPRPGGLPTIASSCPAPLSTVPHRKARQFLLCPGFEIRFARCGQRNDSVQFLYEQYR